MFRINKVLRKNFFIKRFNLQFSNLKRDISESNFKRPISESDLNPKKHKHKFDLENELWVTDEEKKDSYGKELYKPKYGNSIYESENYQKKK
tara:strand:+ start:288 stop:563 length:276 start_codon:yes stop_codon:yes gene_type:complete